MVSLTDIDRMKAMGFSEVDARWALEKYGTIDAAVDGLLSESSMGENISGRIPKNTKPGKRDLAVIPTASTGQSSGGFQHLDTRNPTNVNNSPSSMAPMMDLTNTEEDDLARAIEESLCAKNANPSTSVHLWGNPFENIRLAGHPCGLQNVGNTCYLSSLLQVYFYIPKLRQAILAYNPTEIIEVPDSAVVVIPQNSDPMDIDAAPMPASVPSTVESTSTPSAFAEISLEPNNMTEVVTDPPPSEPTPAEPVTVIATAVIEPQKVRESADLQKRVAIRNMIVELRKLFALMTHSKQASVNPSAFVNSLVDVDGKRIKIGDQQDVTEFNVILLNVLESAFAEVQLATSPSLKRRRSAVTMETRSERNQIRELFASSFVSHITAYEEDESRAETDASSEEVMQLILPVSVDGSAHASLESYTHDDIESFLTKKSYKCNASRDMWFDSFAPYLIVQLQRVQFDAESQTAKKDNTRFRADENLCLERYMTKNRDDVEKIRGMRQELRRTANNLAISLKPLEDFEGSGLSQNRILQLAANILRENSTAHQSTIDLLTTEASAKESLRSKYLREKLSVEQDISQLFSKIDENGQIHELKAVLVHGGDHMYGHYVAFVRTNDLDWWRFSDSNVTSATVADVLASCSGTDSTSSAYFLMYELRNASANILETTLPQDLQDLVNLHNIEFDKSKQEWISRMQRDEVRKRFNRFKSIITQKYNEVALLGDPTDDAYYLQQISVLTQNAGIMLNFLLANRCGAEVLVPGDLPAELKWDDVEPLLKNELRNERWLTDAEVTQRLAPWNPFLVLYRLLASSLFVSINHLLEERFVEAAVVAVRLFVQDDENLVKFQPEVLKKMLVMVLIASLENFISNLQRPDLLPPQGHLPLVAKMVSYVRHCSIMRPLSGALLNRFGSIRTNLQSYLSHHTSGPLIDDVISATAVLMKSSIVDPNTIRQYSDSAEQMDVSHLRGLKEAQSKFRSKFSNLVAELER